jgi:hypothetical protein
VPQEARARPVAQRAAFAAQIPTEVLRQDPSWSPVHHAGGAGKAALPVPRRAVERTENRRRPRAYCRGAAEAVERIPKTSKFLTLSWGASRVFAAVRARTRAREGNSENLTKPDIRTEFSSAIEQRPGARRCYFRRNFRCSRMLSKVDIWAEISGARDPAGDHRRRLHRLHAGAARVPAVDAVSGALMTLPRSAPASS